MVSIVFIDLLYIIVHNITSITTITTINGNAKAVKKIYDILLHYILYTMELLLIIVIVPYN